MSEVSGIELEKDAAGNNSYVRIDLKKYGDRGIQTIRKTRTKKTFL